MTGKVGCTASLFYVCALWPYAPSLLFKMTSELQKKQKRQPVMAAGHVRNSDKLVDDLQVPGLSQSFKAQYRVTKPLP